MEVWLLILFMNGSGKALETLPFHYETKEECRMAMIDAYEEFRPSVEYFCVKGPVKE